MFEKDLERKLVRSVEKNGGKALKLNSGIRGMPDRLILLPGGVIMFVELKVPGKKPRPLQEKRLKDLNRLGFYTEIIDSEKRLDLFESKMKSIYRDHDLQR